MKKMKIMYLCLFILYIIEINLLYGNILNNSSDLNLIRGRRLKRQVFLPNPNCTGIRCGSNDDDILPKNCGFTAYTTKILNGDNVAPGEFPWVAALAFFVRATREISWRCGGALINKNYVVTTAHCIHPAFNNDILSLIRLGEYNLSTRIDCVRTRVGELCMSLPQDFHPTEVLSHPDFDPATVRNDIALIRLSGSVKLNGFIQPICLPIPGLDIASLIGGFRAIVTGWGTTENGKGAEILQRLLIPYVDQQTCRSRLFDGITNSQICFGGEEGRDSCDGDSGSPVVFPKTINGPPFILIGLVSFGNKKCGTRGVPSAYTNVASFTGWIVQNMRP